MRIDTGSTISFGYSSVLKTEWRKGRLPAVKYGFYGGRLNSDNISLEHLLPHSQGGKTELGNLVLATKNNNQNRGAAPLSDYITIKNVTRYLQQFVNVRTKSFDGNKYIQQVLKTLGDLV